VVVELPAVPAFELPDVPASANPEDVTPRPARKRTTKAKKVATKKPAKSTTTKKVAPKPASHRERIAVERKPAAKGKSKAK
jgi:hypothetical protein